MEDSIFAKIIKGDIPSYKIYEDELTIAILDITPNVMGHTLVIPKIQVDQFNDLDDTTYTALWATVKKVANNHQKILGTDRIGLSVKGIDVPHAHVHVLPFNVGESMHHSSNSPNLTEEEFIELAKKLRF